MPQTQELYQLLLEMPSRQYTELIRQVDAERRRDFERDERAHPPRPDMSRDEFVQWIARRHFAIDRGTIRILHLPKGAPPKQVRLLEVNDLISLPDLAPIEAVDFMPAIEGLDYELFVADVTPDQLEAIREGRLALPPGWNFEERQEFDRDQL